MKFLRVRDSHKVVDSSNKGVLQDTVVLLRRPSNAGLCKSS